MVRKKWRHLLDTRIFRKKLSTTYLNKYLQLVGTYDIYNIWSLAKSDVKPTHDHKPKEATT